MPFTKHLIASSGALAVAAAALVFWAVDAAADAKAADSMEAMAGDADELVHIERQLHAREHGDAARWLEEHIRILESGTHRYDPALVRPLTLLGDAYRGLDRPVEALATYQRAVHLTRVNSGLNAAEQVEIVYREADTHKVLGEFQEANEREEYAYHILVRNHQPLDERLLPGIYHLAAWYEHTNNIFAARALYEHAVEIIEANGKADTLKAIPAWHGVATTYRAERYPAYYIADLGSERDPLAVTSMQPMTVNNFPEGERALQRIIQIYQKQPDTDPVRLAEAVLELADWYTLFDKNRRAEPLYAHAWSLLEQAPGFDVVGYFAEPRLLYFPRPESPTPPPLEQRGELATGYVELSCEVSDRGYVRGLATLAAEPEGVMEYRVRKSLRIARYRPVLIDGVPVSRNAHTYRHEFPYYAERDEAPADAPTTVPAAMPVDRAPAPDAELEGYRARVDGARASG